MRRGARKFSKEGAHRPHVVGGRQGLRSRPGQRAGGHRDHARIAVTLSLGGPSSGGPPEHIWMRSCSTAPSTRINARGRRGCSGTMLLLICDQHHPRGTAEPQPSDMRRTGRTRDLLDETEVRLPHAIVMPPPHLNRQHGPPRPDLAGSPAPILFVETGARATGPAARHGFDLPAPTKPRASGERAVFDRRRKEAGKAPWWSGMFQRTPSGVIQAFHFCGTNCGTTFINYCFYWIIGGEGDRQNSDFSRCRRPPEVHLTV